MHTAAEYRQYAQECIDGARAANSDGRSFLNSLKCGLQPQPHWNCKKASVTTCAHPTTRRNKEWINEPVR